MKLDKDHINSIIHGNSRFFSAYSDPDPYFMYTRKGYTEDFEEKCRFVNHIGHYY